MIEITAFVKEICLLGVVCKVSNRKTLSGETFCFPEKRLLSILNLVLRVTYCFFLYELLIGRQPTFLECIVIFRNRIGQICLSSPGYSSHTVRSELRLSCPTLGSSPSKICQMESSLHTQMSEDWRDTHSRACRWGG